MSKLPATRDVTLDRKHLFTIRADGMPKGQPRPRAFSRGGKAAVYDPGTAEGWKSAVAESAKDLAGGAIIHPLSVTLTFFMPRPKSHYRTYGGLKNSFPVFMHDRKPDADNLAKAVLDALTAIRVWQDDDQVCELTIRKYWEQRGTHAPGCVIAVARMMEVEI
jgi:crossover junction endodeoxyribonuclease RusA